MPNFAYPCLVESVSAEMPSEQPPEAVPNFVFTLRDMDVSQPDELAPSALPPGSLFQPVVVALDEQPATFHFAAPPGMDLEYSPDGEAWYAYGTDYPGATRYLRTVHSLLAQAGEPSGRGGWYDRVAPVEESEDMPSALPPGSICETCWDQPATQVLPAPWGGEMGVCVWCAAGEGEESAEPLPEITIAPGVTMDNVEAVWINGVRYVLDDVHGYRVVSASRQ